MITRGQAAAEWRSHWPVVLSGAAGTTLLMVYMYSIGIMVVPLEAEFGWTRAQISSGPAIVSVVTLFLAPFVGMAVDRFGARAIGLVGAPLYCASLAALSLATADLWSWWLLWVVLAVASTAVTPAIWATAVSGLFVASRGLALALMLTGTGIGAFLAPIVAGRLVADHGWRGGYLGLGGLWALVVLPLLFFLFYGAKDRRAGQVHPEPAQACALARLSRRQALLSARFAKLAVAACAIALVIAGINVNLAPLLIDQGIAPLTAGAIAGLAGIGSIVGRLIGGYLLDRVHGALVGGVAVALPIVSILLLILAPGSLPAVTVAVMGLGLSLGVEYDVVAYLTARYFGVQNFGTVFSTIAGLLALVAGAGPLAMNLLHGLTGDYALGLWLCVPACALSSLLFFSLGAYPANASLAEQMLDQAPATVIARGALPKAR